MELEEEDQELIMVGHLNIKQVSSILIFLVDNDIDETTADDEDDKQMKKIGTKKMMKLQAKAEKKALREVCTSYNEKSY